MSFHIYLSGEIHSDWREEIQRGAEAAGLRCRLLRSPGARRLIR